MLLFCYRVTNISNWSKMPKAKTLDPHKFSARDRQHMMAKVTANCEERDGCLMWTRSVNSSGYPQMKIKLPNGTRTNVLVHRLVYAITSGRVLEQALLGEIEYEVSHLCHHSVCMRSNHLVYEPKGVNTDRRSCKTQGLCHREHQWYGTPYPDCKLDCNYFSIMCYLVILVFLIKVTCIVLSSLTHDY
jgi:hypothetical protein